MTPSRLNGFPNENKNRIYIFFLFPHRVYNGHLKRFPDLYLPIPTVICHNWFCFPSDVVQKRILYSTSSHRTSEREHNCSVCLWQRRTLNRRELFLEPSSLLWYSFVRRISESQKKKFSEKVLVQFNSRNLNDYYHTITVWVDSSRVWFLLVSSWTIDVPS